MPTVNSSQAHYITNQTTTPSLASTPEPSQEPTFSTMSNNSTSYITSCPTVASSSSAISTTLAPTVETTTRTPTILPSQVGLTTSYIHRDRRHYANETLAWVLPVSVFCLGVVIVALRQWNRRSSTTSSQTGVELTRRKRKEYLQDNRMNGSNSLGSLNPLQSGWKHYHMGRNLTEADSDNEMQSVTL